MSTTGIVISLLIGVIAGLAHAVWRQIKEIKALQRQLKTARSQIAEIKTDIHQLQLLADYIRQEEILLGGHNMHYCSIYNTIRMN